MRTIRIIEYISLDGVIQHEKDENFACGDWAIPYRSPAGLEAVVEAQGSLTRGWRTCFRQHEGYVHRCAHKHIPVRWITADIISLLCPLPVMFNPNLTDNSI